MSRPNKWFVVEITTKEDTFHGKSPIYPKEISPRDIHSWCTKIENAWRFSVRSHANCFADAVRSVMKSHGMRGKVSVLSLIVGIELRGDWKGDWDDYYKKISRDTKELYSINH